MHRLGMIRYCRIKLTIRGLIAQRKRGLELMEVIDQDHSISVTGLLHIVRRMVAELESTTAIDRQTVLHIVERMVTRQDLMAATGHLTVAVTIKELGAKLVLMAVIDRRIALAIIGSWRMAEQSLTQVTNHLMAENPE